MLQYILVDTTMFGSADDPEQTEKDLCWWLEALTQRDQDYLRQRPNTPRLYKSGVVWEAPKQFGGEPEEVHILREALGAKAKQRDVARVLDTASAIFGGEHFCDIGRILELGAIDCDGLACWRAAELRQAGIPASAWMTSRKRLDGGTTYHALVRWPPFGNERLGNPFRDTSEDPSLLLGMGGASRAADRAEEIRKNIERCEFLRTRGGRSRAAVPMPNNILEDVLGLRRIPREIDPSLEEMDRVLRRSA